MKRKLNWQKEGFKSYKDWFQMRYRIHKLIWVGREVA